MRSYRRSGAALLAATLALLPGTAAAAQQGTVVLSEADVTRVGGRFILSADGASFELAALESPTECPAAGGGTWTCGEGSRRALAAAVAGETLTCLIMGRGDPPPVECTAQTRNLNLWMLQVGWAALRPEWRNPPPAYRDAEQAARAAGAMLWYDPGTEPAEDPANSRPPAGQRPQRVDAGVFLARRQEGDVRVYTREKPPDDDEVPLNYIDFAEDLSTPTTRTGFPLDPNWVPALGTGDSIVHRTNDGRFAYARAPSADGALPLAYMAAAGNVAGRRYATVMLDGMPWSVRRGDLQPARVPLGARAARRGATVAERSAIGAGLPEDRLRAGVWTFGTLRVVVAEDPYACARGTWCRFAVLDEAGTVASGTAREAPELIAQNADGTPAAAPAAPDGIALVWQAPGGAWRRWAP